VSLVPNQRLQVKGQEHTMMKNCVIQSLACLCILVVFAASAGAREPALQIITTDFPPYAYEKNKVNNKVNKDRHFKKEILRPPR